MSDRAAARAAKDHLRAELSGLPGVNGVGIGRRPDGYVVTVSVTEQTVREQVPGSYDGVHVEVRVVGRVRVLGADDGHDGGHGDGHDGGSGDGHDGGSGDGHDGGGGPTG